MSPDSPAVVYCWIEEDYGEPIQVLRLDDDLQLQVVEHHCEGEHFGVFLVEDDWDGEVTDTVRMPMVFPTMDEAKEYAQTIANVMFRSTAYLGKMEIADGLCEHARDGFACQLAVGHINFHEHLLSQSLALQWLGNTTRINSL